MVGLTVIVCIYGTPGVFNNFSKINQQNYIKNYGELKLE